MAELSFWQSAGARWMGSLAIVCAGALWVGCGPHNAAKLDAGRDLSLPAVDFAGFDFAVPHHDLAFRGDLSDGCIHVATWPSNLAIAKYTASTTETQVDAPDSDKTPHAILGIQDWHLQLATETYPKNVTFNSSTRYKSSDVDAIINDGCDTTSCATQYFAQGGSVKITQADTNETTGRMTASGNNLKFVEWDFTGDMATGTKCYEVASVTLDIAWSN